MAGVQSHTCKKSPASGGAEEQRTKPPLSGSAAPHVTWGRAQISEQHNIPYSETQATPLLLRSSNSTAQFPTGALRAGR